MPSSASQAPEPKLVAAARRGERAAWDSLLRQIQLPLYAYAAELIRDREQAFDIVQESFAAAVKNIGTLREDARFHAWLFGIAHQRCLAHFRRDQRTRVRFDTETNEATDPIDDQSESPADTLAQAEDSAHFLALLERLPAPQRSVLLLHVLEDFSLEDIARITEVPLGTVKSRLHHAKRALRSLVEETP